MARGRRNPPQGEVGGEGLDAAVEFRRAIKAEQDRDNIPLAEAYQLFVDNGPEDTILGMEQNTICSTTGTRMAWERRQGRLYYYAVRRQNGQVVRQYLGRGQEAVAAAEGVAVRKAARVVERQQRQADLAIADQMATIGNNADALVVAALVAAGYHRPQRKRWRKQRSWRIENGNSTGTSGSKS